MGSPYTISQFIEKLQELADGYGDVPLSFFFEGTDIIWDVDDADFVEDELNEDDGRIYLTLK